MPGKSSLADPRWCSHGPSTYRKRTRGAEPAARLFLAAARYVSLSRPANVCASTVTSDNTRICNSAWIAQRMPMSGSCVLAQSWAELLWPAVAAIVNSANVIHIKGIDYANRQCPGSAHMDLLTHPLAASPVYRNPFMSSH
jgi:hypothetical protein